MREGRSTEGTVARFQGSRGKVKTKSRHFHVWSEIIFRFETDEIEDLLFENICNCLKGKVETVKT